MEVCKPFEFELEEFDAMFWLAWPPNDAVLAIIEFLALTICSSVFVDEKLPTLEAKFCCAVPLAPDALLTTAVLTNMVACNVGVLLEPPLPLPLPWLPLPFPLSEANEKAAAVVAMMAIAVLVSFFMMISLRKMKRSFVKCQRLIFDSLGKFQKDMATVFGFLSLFFFACV